MKKRRVLRVLFAVFLLLFAIWGFLYLKNNNNIIGFAVDSEGNVYVGKIGEIKVYKNGKHLKTIDSITSRGYSFAIVDDEIIIDTGNYLYNLDLDGNVIGKEASQRKLVNSYFYTDDKGNTFSLIDKNFQQKRIIKNNFEVVYAEPIISTITRIGFAVCFVCVFVLGTILFIPYTAYNFAKTKTK